MNEMSEAVGKSRRITFIGAAVLGTLMNTLLAVGSPATALAAIAFVQNLGTAQGQAVAALNIVTTGPVAAGDSIVVSVAYDNGTNNPSPVRAPMRPATSIPRVSRPPMRRN